MANTAEINRDLNIPPSWRAAFELKWGKWCFSRQSCISSGLHGTSIHWMPDSLPDAAVPCHIGPSSSSRVSQRSVKATSRDSGEARRAGIEHEMSAIAPHARAMPQSGMPICEASILIQYFVPATTWNGVGR